MRSLRELTAVYVLGRKSSERQIERFGFLYTSPQGEGKGEK